MESEDNFLLHIKKCKIYENSDGMNSKSKSKLNLNEKKPYYQNIFLKKKNENAKSNVKKRRKRKGNKKKKNSSSVNKYTIALNLYHKQLKENYEALSLMQEKIQPPTEIEIIEDKYKILKNKNNSLSSLLPKKISDGYNNNNKNSLSFIPILAQKTEYNSENNISYNSNNNNNYNNNNNNNYSLLDNQLNSKSIRDSMYLLEKNISLINTKKKYEFHKFTRRNPYDFEKHGNINYTKILKSMSNSKMKRSNSNLSTLNNSNENVNIKYQHSNNSLNSENDNNSSSGSNISKLEDKSRNSSMNSSIINLCLDDYKNKYEKDIRDTKETNEIKEYKEKENTSLKKKNNDKYSSVFKLNVEKQNIRMKSFHRNFYSKLDNFTKSDVLYQYNNMIYKDSENKINNYIKRNKSHDETLSSIKVGSNVYYNNKYSLNLYNKDNKYRNRELENSNNSDIFNDVENKIEINEKNNICSLEETKKQIDDTLNKRKKIKDEINKKGKEKTYKSEINNDINFKKDTMISYINMPNTENNIEMINNNGFNFNTEDMKYYDENSTEFDEFNYENDINDFNNGSNNLENEYENENKNESKNKNDNENKNENDNDNDNENRNGDGNNDESLKDKNKYTNEMTTSNNTSSNINNDNNNLGLLATKKLLSFSKTKKNTIHKRTVTQRSITSRAKSASSVKNLKSTKSSNKKKNSSTSNENNNGDSTGSFEIKKLRNDIVEIQELMSKSTQPVAIYSYLISKNNTNIDSVINALNNITELCDYQNVFKLIYNFSQISYQCISYLSKIGLTNKTLKVLLKLNQQYQIHKINSVNSNISIPKNTQKTLFSIFHLIIEILLILSTVEKRIHYSLRVRSCIPTIVGLIYLWNTLNQDKKVIQCFNFLNAISKNVNNVTELLSSTNILHIHKIYFQKWTKFSKARNACLLNLLQCFSLQKKFRKNILLTYSMNLILKIFLMEKDFTNQKNILKIIKCLILDEKGKQQFLDSNGMKLFYQKIKSLPTGNLIEKNKNKKKIVELYLMMIDIIRCCQPKTTLPFNTSLKVWNFYEIAKLKLRSIDKDMNIRAILSSVTSNNDSHDSSNNAKENSYYNRIYNLTNSSQNHINNSNVILQHINENITSLYSLHKEMEENITENNVEKKDLSQFFPEINVSETIQNSNSTSQLKSSSSNLALSDSNISVNTIKTLGNTVTDMTEPLLKRTASTIRYILLNEVNKYISSDKHPTSILVYDRCNDSIAKSFISEPNILKFDSNFESGNLELAVKICDYEYDLYLQSDSNVERGQHNQWFYFSVSKMIPNVLYKFNIINMTKAYSQFKLGMQPIQYSIKEKVWRRNGTHIDYYRNNYIRTKGKKKVVSKKCKANKQKNEEEESKSDNGSNEAPQNNKSPTNQASLNKGNNENINENTNNSDEIDALLKKLDIKKDKTEKPDKYEDSDEDSDNNNNNKNENNNNDNDDDNDEGNYIENEMNNDNSNDDIENEIRNEIKNIEEEIEQNDSENDNDDDLDIAYEDDNDEENSDDDNDDDINNKSKSIEDDTTSNENKNKNNGSDDSPNEDYEAEKNDEESKNETDKETTFYYSTLSFSAYTPYENDCVYFCYHYPYTYSDLQRYINSLIKEISPNIVKRQTLCKTIMGNDCDLLTITDFVNENKKMDKPYVLLTGRVHPGESNSSFIMEGLIDFLVSSHPKAIFLRQNIIFKIVPMLNPDGVILGSQRCNLAGLDLNRQWSENKVSPKTSPTIYWTKTLWNYIIDEKEGLGSKVLLYCDFHGHSRKKNIFLYGCELDKSEIVGDITEKTFPTQMNNHLNYFDIDSCKYVIEEYKKSTARVVGYQELKTYYSYTLECSFAGYENKFNKQEHYHPKHLKHIGASFIKSLYQFYNILESKKKISNNNSSTSLDNITTNTSSSSTIDLLSVNNNESNSLNN